jgi:hypothetical protein
MYPAMTVISYILKCWSLPPTHCLHISRDIIFILSLLWSKFKIIHSCLYLRRSGVRYIQLSLYFPRIFFVCFFVALVVNFLFSQICCLLVILEWVLILYELMGALLVLIFLYSRSDYSLTFFGVGHCFGCLKTEPVCHKQNWRMEFTPRQSGSTKKLVTWRENVIKW